MKKKINKPMRAAGVLLVATMLSTCLTAGTFAKYTTTDSATDSARVAKFGVVVNANGNLYGKEYDPNSGTNANKPIAWSTIATNTGTVQAYSNTTSSDVVAPGTKSAAGLGFNINGTPEVDVSLNLDIATMNIYLKAGRYGVMKPVTVTNQSDLDAAWAAYGDAGKVGLYYSTVAHGGTYTKIDAAPVYNAANKYFKLDNDVTLANDYFPVQYSMTGTTTNFNAATTTSDSLGDGTASVLKSITTGLATALGATASTPTSAAIGSYHTYNLTVNNIPANNSLDAKLALQDQNIQWKWEYYTDATTDKMDTILGDLVSQKNTESVNGLTTDTTFTTTNEVVKITTSGAGVTTAVAPTEATYGTTTINGTEIKTITAENDFCLYTEFYVGATVTQVD